MAKKEKLKLIRLTFSQCLSCGWIGIIVALFVVPLVLILHSQGWYQEEGKVGWTLPQLFKSKPRRRGHIKRNPFILLS